MEKLSGVCAVVPRHQKGFRPKVYGMGILVDDHELITCAHVVDAAIGEGWFDQPGDGGVRVCFPFGKGETCVKGTVDRARYFPQNLPKQGVLTDIAVIRLDEPAPAAVGRADLREHVEDSHVKVLGFRMSELDGDWISHPYGEIPELKVVKSLPGGRVYMEQLRSTGAAMEPGFSGGGVYDSRLDTVVGMADVASAESGRISAQFIDAASLRKALGRDLPLHPNLVQAIQV